MQKTTTHRVAANILSVPNSMCLLRAIIVVQRDKQWLFVPNWIIAHFLCRLFLTFDISFAHEDLSAGYSQFHGIFGERDCNRNGQRKNYAQPLTWQIVVASPVAGASTPWAHFGRSNKQKPLLFKCTARTACNRHKIELFIPRIELWIMFGVYSVFCLARASGPPDIVLIWLWFRFANNAHHSAILLSRRNQ